MAEKRAEAEEQAGGGAQEERIAEEAVATLAEGKEARVREAGDRLRHCRTRTGGGEGRRSSMARAGGEAVVGPAVQPTQETGGSADTADAGKRDAGSQTCVEGGTGRVIAPEAAFPARSRRARSSSTSWEGAQHPRSPTTNRMSANRGAGADAAADADDASAKKRQREKNSDSNHNRSKRNNGDGNNTATTTTGSAVAEDAPRS